MLLAAGADHLLRMVSHCPCRAETARIRIPLSGTVDSMSASAHTDSVSEPVVLCCCKWSFGCGPMHPVTGENTRSYRSRQHRIKHQSAEARDTAETGRPTRELLLSRQFVPAMVVMAVSLVSLKLISCTGDVDRNSLAVLVQALSHFRPSWYQSGIILCTTPDWILTDPQNGVSVLRSSEKHCSAVTSLRTAWPTRRMRAFHVLSSRCL